MAALSLVLPTFAQEPETSASPAAPQQLSESQKASLERIVSSRLPENFHIGRLKTRDVALHGDTVAVDLSENFGDLPFTRADIDAMRKEMLDTLGDGFANHKVKLTIAGEDIGKYFIGYEDAYKRSHSSFINHLDPNRHYSKGLDGNIIALWQSHGWYFEPKLDRWEWQRARMFQTVEDLYTQSYVLPFLAPMLENAGAYVWDPRERDANHVEVIVDNDGHLAQDGYDEHNEERHWRKGSEAGFAYKREAYREFENPFTEGTYREVEATGNKKKISTATWDVEVPKTGEYAIYISYKTLPNSIKDAHYVIKSLGQPREFTVDQTMGGGVWVYVGHYRLAAGKNKDVVTVSNLSSSSGVVTADAVKVGGGMGNVERRVALPTEENIARAKKDENEKYIGQPGVDYQWQSSRHPRYTEGARYWLQWSGFPKEVYSPSAGINDYTDDYRCRGLWVNWLAGGSQVLPGQPGLNVPVDLSLAFHSDAGTTQNDDIIGTLGIYCTNKNDKRFGVNANGTPKELSRNLTATIMDEIVGDIRAEFEPAWSRRGMWDKSYYEARVPEVPAMLLELLSHQNFADMKYGLDPAFRFTVSRAIYKGMLKFIAQRDHRDYQVQPLPVNSFAITPSSEGVMRLSWNNTRDARSKNADAKKYIIEERVGREGGFKEIAVTDKTYHIVTLDDNNLHSYRVIAVNDGGRSFPSETLSAGMAKNSKGNVMVINNFTRVSAPDWFDSGEMAGFYDAKDHGVPYINEYNYIGAQYEFRRKLPWRDDDSGGFGDSRADHETQVLAGNTFDYPSVHGEALLKAGYSFVSASVKAVESDAALLAKGYTAVDVINGKQKETKLGRGAVPNRYKSFTPALMAALRNYTAAGGNVLLTGAYVATDIWDRDKADEQAQDFAKNVLGYEYLNGRAATDGQVRSVTSRLAVGSGKTMEMAFATKLNSEVYAAESPDAIRASDSKGAVVMRYSQNNLPAAVASDRGNYRTFIAGFPLETVMSSEQRTEFMVETMKFLTKDNK